MKSNKRKHKRFDLNNTLIQFNREKPRWGRILDISQKGLNVLSNLKFEEGEIVKVKFNPRNVPSLQVNQDYLTFKIKIEWTRPTSEKKGIKTSYGASFFEMGDENMKQLKAINDSLDKMKKKGDIKIENLLSDVRVFLENMGRPK